MPKPNRSPRAVPNDGRSHRGLAPHEFTPYGDTEGRVQPDKCTHPIFLDHQFGVTGLCLECGYEIVLETWEIAVAKSPISRGSSVEYVPEAVTLTDEELDAHRHRWHAIWGLDGWTHPTPELEGALPPDRLKNKLDGPPAAREVKGKFRGKSKKA